MNALLTIADFQKLNSDIYGAQNIKNYEVSNMVARMHGYVGLVLKAARTENTFRLNYDLRMAFSWSLAIWNKWERDLAAEIWKKYPDVCPYCGTCPCTCKPRPESRLKFDEKPHRPGSMTQFQSMLAGIYPNNTFLKSAAHLSEELAEVHKAWEYFRGTHKPELFMHAVEELADANAHIFAVATCSDFRLAQEMMVIFKDGCPTCHNVPCLCGYTIAQSTSIR